MAEKARLRYVTDEVRGIRRRRRGRGFSYSQDDGSQVSEADRERIAALAVPPAWDEVWICSHALGHIQATGRDTAGRKQYRYHTLWEQVRDEAKFDRMLAFGEQLPTLRNRLASDLAQQQPGHGKVVALAVAVLDRTLIRVGNHRYATENGSFGLTTMKSEHADITGKAVQFSFAAKGGANLEIGLDDPRLSELIKQCQELDGQTLFSYADATGVIASITSEDVNQYLRSTMGNVSAKDFRTWGGSAHVVRCLADRRSVEQVPEQAVHEAVDSAAEALGNSRPVCLRSYIHPEVVASFQKGTLTATWFRTRSGRYMARSERVLVRILAKG